MASRYIPYQIDYSISDKGKHLGMTKKKISWKFGFANLDALAQGKEGPECRGSEHEVELIYSINSGKRQVLCDGREIHFSMGHSGWVDPNWSTTFNFPRRVGAGRRDEGEDHVLSIATRRGGAASIHSHPYDFKVDGLSYFEFPKIYELGTVRMQGQFYPVLQRLPAPERHHHTSRSFSPDHVRKIAPLPNSPQEESKMLAEAKVRSLRDLRVMEDKKHQSMNASAPQLPPVNESLDLLTFNEEDKAAGPPAYRPPFERISTITIDADAQDDVPDDVTTGSWVNSYPQLNPNASQRPSFFQSQPPQYSSDGSMRDLRSSYYAPSTQAPSAPPSVAPSVPPAYVAAPPAASPGVAASVTSSVSVAPSYSMFPPFARPPGRNAAPPGLSFMASPPPPTLEETQMAFAHPPAPASAPPPAPTSQPPQQQPQWSNTPYAPQGGTPPTWGSQYVR